VVGAFSLCIAALSTVSALPLALGAAFAVAGKALGRPWPICREAPMATRNWSPVTIRSIELIRWVLPDLSRLDWREWAMYQLAPGGEVVFWSVTMAVAYIVLLLVLCEPAVFKTRVFLMRRSLSR
jgi:Cu-processing system permease protein